MMFHPELSEISRFARDTHLDGSDLLRSRDGAAPQSRHVGRDAISAAARRVRRAARLAPDRCPTRRRWSGFQAGGVVVGPVRSRSELAADTVVEDSGGWGGITLAHNVGSREAVDALLEEAVGAGGTVRRPGAPHGMGRLPAASSSDPDGHCCGGRPRPVLDGPPRTVCGAPRGGRAREASGGGPRRDRAPPPLWPPCQGHPARAHSTVPPLAIVSADVSRTPGPRAMRGCVRRRRAPRRRGSVNSPVQRPRVGAAGDEAEGG